ncbi:hypothetical protein NBO_377g0002 [Nosema bombycis CQ1]|uniref:Uncharacterized protein n=1 Tax=Nosema bombycis (strain CQ1 / CVCC 102059) TaxID=578461 RepID=R0KR67_NOSB1|nr:hypothetical protein NBO_377g0002 [Nosema bombycis CQ1]|eukprot:EOB12707.1 hypothetical protein NBO_377g0002 [Nosema bombycis CQ1]
MKDSWEIIFEHIRINDIILKDLHSFNDEQIYFLTKSLTSNPTRWPLPETLSFYKSVFQGSTPTLKNPINITILDLYGSSLLCLLNQNQTQKLSILNLYCEIILDYTGNLESSSILVQDTIGEMLRKALVLNVTTFGPLILQTLQTFLRLSIPDNWDKFFLIIEMCSISPLHSDLFQVLILIIEKYLDLISPNDFLILLSCIEDLLNNELSNKVMMSMLEIGECLISIRVMNKQIEFYEVWKSYLIILYEFTKDPNLRDKSLRNLFRFINSDYVLLSPIENEFLIKKILIPLINETKEEIVKDKDGNVDKNRVDKVDNIKGDTKLPNKNIAVNNTDPPSSFIFTLLDELSKHDPLKFNNISYLESQLDLIKTILNSNFINLDLISKCLTPLSIRIQPPSISILTSLKSSKIHFENSIPYDLVNETIFKFYKNLIEEYEKYPPKCYLLLLEDLKRFEKGKIKENIKMFDKILLGEEEVVKKVIEVLLSGGNDKGDVKGVIVKEEVGKVKDVGVNVNVRVVNKEEPGLNKGYVKEEPVLSNDDVLNGTSLLNNATPILNTAPSLAKTTPLQSPSPHSSFILNYLLDFMTKSPFLASLLMKESKKSLNSKTICKFLKKIREVLDLYESLWEECLENTQEVGGLVEGEEEFKEFVELSREIFLKGMEIKEDENKDKDGDKGDNDKDRDKDKEGNNPFDHFQIYNNKQFSHYLEHDPLKTKIVKDPDLKRTLSISKTLEYRRRERLLLKYLIIYYTKISKENRGVSKEEGGIKGKEGGMKEDPLNQDKPISNLPLNQSKALTNLPLTNLPHIPNTHSPFSVVLSLTQIKNSKPFNFYNLAFKSYHLLFLNINPVFDELLLILRKTLKNYNEEEKLNNMLFSTIKQKEIYLVFELLIETRNKKLIENLKIEMLNCLKNKDLNVVEYVRKSLMVIFE